MGPVPPFVIVERLRDVSRENGYRQRLDSHGDSADGHVIQHHAVSHKPLSTDPYWGWFLVCSWVVCVAWHYFLSAGSLCVAVQLV